MASSTDEETRAFFQRRLGMFGLMAGSFFVAILAIRVVLTIATDRVPFLAHPSMLGHLGAAMAFVGAWGVARGKPRAMRTLRRVEAAVVLVASGATVVMSLSIPVMGHPQKIVLLALSLGLFVRVIYIPSSAKRTFWLMLSVAAMAIPGAYFSVIWNTPQGFLELMEVLGGTDATAEQLAIGWALESAFYWAFVIGLCTAGSQVVYGLRREVRNTKKLGQYTLERLLGEGGMGAVYRANHAMLRRPTAVKLLLPDKAGHQALARFEREVQLTAQLTHANTITVFDYGRTPEGTFYYAMELLDGATVGDIVEVGGPQSAERVRHILAACAGALAEAHSIGLIHRDVKPGNIMLCSQGGESDVPKVLDFGLVKQLGADVSSSLSASTAVVGTPLYLSPEAVISAESLDGRADIYALGAVGYYLLTGQHVFDGGNVIEVCMKHVNEVPMPPSERLGAPVHPGLEALVLHCLKKSPDDRPQTAKELRDALVALEGLPRWDGTWWWDEYAPAVAELRGEKTASALAHTIDVDMFARSDRKVPS